MNLIKLGNYYYIFDKTLHSSQKGVSIMLYKKINVVTRTHNYTVFNQIVIPKNNKSYKEIIIKKNTYTNGTNELKYMMQLQDNKNFVKCLGYFKNEFNVYTATKYYKNGSLLNHVNTLPSGELDVIFNKILDIIEYMDSIGINHGDLKESNVLLNNKMNPIINDLESMHNKNLKSSIVTKKYTIPNNAPDDINKDVWSLSVMKYYAKNKKYPPEHLKYNQIENFITSNIS